MSKCLWHRFVVCVAMAVWASSATATCHVLIDTLDRATEGFAAGKTPDPDALKDIERLISGMNNDLILRMLQDAGQASRFGDLRNFLTHLRLIAHSGKAGDVQMTETLASDLQDAKDIVQSACIQPDGSLRLLAAEEQGLPSNRWDANSVFEWKKLNPLTVHENMHLRKLHDLGSLVLLIVGFLLIIPVTIGLHFGIIAARIINRGRKTCDVPIQLECMADMQDARLAMLGCYGGIVIGPSDRPSDQLASLTEGTHCNLHIADRVVNARVFDNKKGRVSVWFSSPLTHAARRSVQSQSLEPPQYDFTILRGAHHRGATFGLGSLPFQ